ncbi:hypothetical protein [Streptomyces griseosporeus]|nr:hypothetical protein [Streptomyces griseosporeus]GHF72602.1 hypothetical protein GCM10018783_47530 [Streptomyces griseosporeus]
MPTDPYAVLRALLRAEAQRSVPKPDSAPKPQEQPRQDHER